LGQGRDAVKDLIKDNPELMDELEAKIKEKVKGNDDVLLDKEPKE
jgi:recombination protein RecA